MRFHAYHGIHDFEARDGNEFVVDLSFSLNLERAAANDDISETVNYELVYGIVDSEMEKRSGLLEHVAYRIKQRVLKEWPRIDTIRVRVTKIRPPIQGEIASTAVELTGDRSDLHEPEK